MAWEQTPFFTCPGAPEHFIGQPMAGNGRRISSKSRDVQPVFPDVSRCPDAALTAQKNIDKCVPVAALFLNFRVLFAYGLKMDSVGSALITNDLMTCSV